MLCAPPFEEVMSPSLLCKANCTAPVATGGERQDARAWREAGG
jgi:hypothetical protein